MKFLVTGGSGFIGSHIVDKLIETNNEVVVIDNESADCNEKFYWNDKSENHKLDICDYEKTRKLYDGVDYVFHLAAESRIQPAIENPMQTVLSNSYGTCVVLQCSKESGVKRLVYSSTSSAYGKGDLPNIETGPDDCLTPYSVSKVSGEKLCKVYYHLYGLQTISLRYFNVYGNRQPIKGHYAPVVGLFLRQRNNNQPLTIVGDGNQRRDFTHVSDIVNANMLACLKTIDDSDLFGQVYNVGTNTNYSINQIANMISDHKVNIAPRLGESRVTLAHNLKFKKVFGWEPKINLKEWIESQ
jgi:UDP-glucose 4-epimerase